MTENDIISLFGKNNYQQLRKYLSSLPADHLVSKALSALEDFEVLELIKRFGKLESQTCDSLVPEWICVESSNIDSVRYHSMLQILDIRFSKSKNICYYSYADVPKDVFLEFLNTNSKGGFYHDEIREDFKCTKHQVVINH